MVIIFLCSAYEKLNYLRNYVISGRVCVNGWFDSSASEANYVLCGRCH